MAAGPSLLSPPILPHWGFQMKRLLLLGVALFGLAAPLSANAADKLLNASYDVARELFAAENEAFVKAHPGVTIDQSHGGTSKQARAIGQVGTKLTDDFAASLGYPLEIRLARNPGSVKVGEQLSFQVLQQGTPVPNLRVYVGHRADAPVKGGHGSATLLRTDAQGQASFQVTTAKTWYIHTNHMVPSTQKGLDFVSDRASLSFEISPHAGH